MLVLLVVLRYVEAEVSDRLLIQGLLGWITALAASAWSTNQKFYCDISVALLLLTCLTTVLTARDDSYSSVDKELLGHAEARQGSFVREPPWKRLHLHRTTESKVRDLDFCQSGIASWFQLGLKPKWDWEHRWFMNIFLQSLRSNKLEDVMSAVTPRAHQLLWRSRIKRFDRMMMDQLTIKSSYVRWRVVEVYQYWFPGIHTIR